MYDIVVSIIASQFIGAFWYSPIMIGKQWSCLVYPGCSIEEIKTFLSAKVNYGIAFVSSVILTLLLKFYILQSVTGVGESVNVAILLGGFSATLEVSHYGFEGRPWKLFIIDHIHNFLTILVINCTLTSL